MAKSEKRKDLFTATEVARFCQVDLKTIHNWADRGEIRHFRTPGRHLRFQRNDVLDFLRKYGYPIPDSLGADHPRVLVIADAAVQVDAIVDALASPFETEGSGSVVRGLLSLGAKAPDALVVAGEPDGLDVRELIEGLSELPTTRHMRVVLFGGAREGREPSSPEGATARVEAGDLEELRSVLEALMGLSR